MKLTDLIAAAPWREAVTYRDTRPHEYVLPQRDGQRTLVEAVCRRDAKVPRSVSIAWVKERRDE